MNAQCSHVRAKAVDLATSSLDEAEEATLSAHLRSCDACRAYLQRISAALALERASAPALETPVSERIWRGVLGGVELPRREWFRPLAIATAFELAAAAAIVIVVSLPVLSPPNEEPVASETAWIARRQGVLRTEGESERPSDAATLAAGARLRTLEDAAVDLVVGGDLLLVGEETVLELSELSSAGLTVELSQGTLDAAIQPGRPRRDVRVAAPYGDVTVTGTVFRVTAGARDEVAVARGQVRVALRDETVVLVDAGTALDVRTRTLRALVPDELASMLFITEAPWLPRDGDGARGLLQVEEEGLELTVDGRAVGLTPMFVRWPVGPAAVVLRGRCGEEHQAVVVQQGGAQTLVYTGCRAADPTYPRATAGGRRDGSTIPAPSLDALLAHGDCVAATAQARALVAAKDPQGLDSLSLAADCYAAAHQLEQALAIYRELADYHADTRTGENALFEVGRLAEARGRTDEARAAFLRYRQLHPAGVLAGEAKLRLCDADLRQSNLAAARRCFLEYRVELPRGPKVEWALVSEATLAVELEGDCKLATDLLEAFPTRAPYELREHAARLRVDCLRRLADPRFRAAAEAYLAEFPRGPHAETVRAWVAQ